MAIVWLGSRWLQLEQPAASAVPFTQYRLLHDFGWEESGKNARQALKLAHRGYVLETGAITCSGTGQELLCDERVKDAYLGE